MTDLPLAIGRRRIHTVFDLLGHTENDLTYSLGWALSRSPCLITELMAATEMSDSGTARSISLQEASSHGGYTDIEMRFDAAHLILEAKRGWTLPTLAQLTKYRARLYAPGHGRLLVISEASHAFASRQLPAAIDGAPVLYAPWSAIIEASRLASRASVRNAERRLLDDLRRYLQGAISMQDPFSTWTYCVSISNKTLPGWTDSLRSFIDRGIYFHAYGISGWPKTAPSFLAFRWANTVQRVHHVDEYRIVTDLSAEFEGVPHHPDVVRPHAIYKLGPAIKLNPLPSGATYRAVRLWVALDLLLTAPTLKEAILQTRQRRNGQIEPP